jgi:hypothetical protein
VPGWYQDPAGVAAYRWWDGADWTEGTHDGAAPEPVAAFEPAVAPVFEPAVAPVFEPERAPAPFEPIVFESAVFEPAAPRVPRVEGPSAPAAPAPPAAPASAPVIRRGVSPAKTRWSTILTAYPFVYPFAVGTVVGLAYAGGSSTNMSSLPVIALAAAVVLLLPTVLLVERDRRELAARGYEPAPSPAWLLLLPPIAYLVVRRRLVGPA